jgi:endonuclease-8
MPEGHTLFRLATSLRDAFAGEVVGVSSPQGRFAESAALLDGTRLLEARSFGKHLFVEFEQARLVHVHLGLYGKFPIFRGPAPEPVGQVRMRLVGGSSYADLRGATACDLITDEQREAVLDRLGPDPLDPTADPDRAWQRIHRSRAPVGGLLMDQSVLAGVGNVYRAEVLFRHKMHPLRPGRTLRVGQWQAMWDDLVDLMADGVRSGRIETLRPEDRAGQPRSVRNYAYRRTGEPCLVCGARIRTAELQGRNLFWCPRCQPVFRSRALR